VGYLVNNGLAPWGAAGLVSRWMNVEAAGGPASVNPTSGAFGIAQWLGARKLGIAGNTNFDTQLAYVVQELNSTESAAGAMLRTASDAYSGAVGASAYERAEGSKQMYPRDNFTDRTAAGAPSVMQNWQGTSSPINYDEGIQTSDSSMFQDFAADPTSGIGIGGVAVVAVVALWFLSGE